MTDGLRSDQVSEQALRWFARLHSGETAEEERRAFALWLGADPVRQNAYAQFTGLWNDLDGLQDHPFPELDRVREEWSVGKTDRSPASQRIAVAVSIAATIAAVVTGIWWWELFGIGVRTAEYKTAVGEQRTVTLEDGSAVALNAATSISVSFSRRSRMVDVHKGEALFTVAHETDRPFAVRAANGRTWDLGTRYSVRRYADHVLVSVFEGAVEVRTQSSDSAGLDHRILHEGEAASYGSDGRISSTVPVNQDVATAWLKGRLIFEHARLADVIEDVSRYRTGELRLLDADLGSLEVSGVFNLRELEAFPRALEDALPVKTTRVSPRLTIIERARAR